MSYMNRGPGTVSNMSALPPGAGAGHFPYDAGGGGGGAWEQSPSPAFSSSLHLGTSPVIGIWVLPLW